MQFKVTYDNGQVLFVDAPNADEASAHASLLHVKMPRGMVLEVADGQSVEVSRPQIDPTAKVVSAEPIDKFARRRLMVIDDQMQALAAEVARLRPPVVK